MIDWGKITPEDFAIIQKIAERAYPLFTEAGVPCTRMDVLMDIEAAHLACPLKLEELLAAPEPDFGHDMTGIYRHLNRETGELENYFLPRYAQPEQAGETLEDIRTAQAAY
jgi:hypothetical protein